MLLSMLSELQLQSKKTIAIKGGHSIVLSPRPSPQLSSDDLSPIPSIPAAVDKNGMWNHAIFYHVGGASAEQRSLEWYPRPDGSHYGCEYGWQLIDPDEDLPTDPSLAHPHRPAIT